MLSPANRTPAAVVASGALHVLLAVSAYRSSPPARPSRTQAMRIEIAILPQPDPSLAAGSAPAEGEEEPASRQLPVRSGRHAARASAAAGAEVVAPPPASSALGVAKPASEESAMAPAPARARGVLNLSAESAARSLLASEAGTWRVAASESALLDASEREARAEEARLAKDIAGLTRNGDDRGIIHSAQDAVSFALRPWKLITEPLRASRYHYRGLGFDAIIQADGGVRFRGKSGVHLAFIPVKDIEGNSVTMFGLGSGGDLLNRANGRDAHASERRTFLEHTRALRAHLYQHALRAARARADQHLTRTLAGLALQLERGNDRNARAALFELWDECSEDELGTQARRRLERFAREHCLPGTPLGYEPSELAALNARRLSKPRFEPYTSVELPPPAHEPAAALAGDAASP